jgi:hypothetical protein
MPSLELAIDDRALVIEVGPRALSPRIGFDGLSACRLQSAGAVERAVNEEVERGPERPPNSFDPESYEHALRCVAGNINRSGKYIEETRRAAFCWPVLLVTDLWVFLCAASGICRARDRDAQPQTRGVPVVEATDAGVRRSKGIDGRV